MTSPPCPCHDGVWCDWSERCSSEQQHCAFSDAEIRRVQELGGTLDATYPVVTGPSDPCVVPLMHYGDGPDWHRPVTLDDCNPARVALMLDVCDAAEELSKARALPPSANGRIFEAVTALECCSKRLVVFKEKHP